MQTRSFSKAFRNTILRTWWIPFLFAAIAGPVVYTTHELGRENERFVAMGKILLEMPDGRVPTEAVVTEHETVLESQVMQVKSKEFAAQLLPEAAFADETSVDATPVKGSGIINLTCRGRDAEIVREVLRLQMQIYVKGVEVAKQGPTPEAAVLDLANVTPRVLEWPGPAVESKSSQAILSGLLACLSGAFAGMVCMLLISGVWAFFRPAWIQPSLDEIMKAADGLDAKGRAELLERVVGGAGAEVRSRDTA